MTEELGGLILTVSDAGPYAGRSYGTAMRALDVLQALSGDRKLQLAVAGPVTLPHPIAYPVSVVWLHLDKYQEVLLSKRWICIYPARAQLTADGGMAQ